MRRVHSRDRGLGLLVAVIVLGFALGIVGVTVCIVGDLVTRTSRRAQQVRSRAAAEAGIEVGLLRLLRAADAAVAADIKLGGAECKVRSSKGAEVLVLDSTGRVPSGGGSSICRIRVSLARLSNGALRIISRVESYEHMAKDSPVVTTAN